MKRITAGISILLLAALGASPAWATTIIIGQPADVGNGNCFPFGCSPGTRYQQVYNANLFAGPFLINQLQFFNTEESPGAGIIDTATYAIHFSSTARAVTGAGGLSTADFNSNVGPDDAVFFSGVLGGPIGGTTFTITGTSFLYDPANGNLLLDIFKTGGSADFSVLLDARNGSFGSDSSRAHDFGTAFESWGLVTGFSNDELAPVPEPATLLLLGPTLAWAAWRRYDRR